MMAVKLGFILVVHRIRYVGHIYLTCFYNNLHRLTGKNNKLMLDVFVVAKLEWVFLFSSKLL